MLNPQKQAHQRVRRLTKEGGMLRRVMARSLNDGELPIHEMRRRLNEIQRAQRDARRFAGRRWS
jgi:hypothetical protein